MDKLNKPSSSQVTTPETGIECDESVSSDTSLFGRLIGRATSAAVPNLNPAISSIAGLSENLQRIIPVVESMSEQVNMAAVDVSNVSRAILDLTSAVRSFVESVPTLKQYVDIIVEVIDLLYNFAIAWCKKIFALVPSFILRILRLFGVPQDLVMKIVGLIMKLFMPKETNQAVVNFSNLLLNERVMEQQGQNDTMLGHIFSTVVGMIMLKREPSQNELRYVNDMMRFKFNLKNEVNDSVSFILTCLQRLPEEMQLWLQYVMPLRWWTAMFAPGSEYYNWIDEVNSLHSHAFKERASYDLALQERIRKLYQDGLKLVQTCSMSGPSFNQVGSLLKDSIKKVEELFDMVDISALQRSSRPVPFVVYLSGRPGQGKSFISTVLPAVLANTHTSEPNLIFSRNPAIPHWDGYTGQFAVQYDDFAAIRGGNVSPGETAEMISIVSNEQYRLPMAHLENKGEVFRSKAVIITSNQGYPRPNELAEPIALWRRRHAFFEVRVLPEFLILGRQEVDPTRVPDDCSHWRFQEKHPTLENNGNIGAELTYPEFIRSLKRKYEQHVEEQRRGEIIKREMADNAVLMEQQGKLMDDFRKAFRSGVVQGRSAAQDFFEQLQQFELEEHQTPLWAQALWDNKGIIAALIGIICTAWYMSRQHAREVKNLTEVVKAYAPRIMDKEGRWAPLFNDSTIPKETKDQIEEAMSSFDGVLTDNQVEQVIENVRKKNSYFSEGAYHGVHTGHQRQQRAPRTVMRMQNNIMRV